jgi:hypothetical protein
MFTWPIIKGAVVISSIAAFSTGAGMLADAIGNDTPITLGGALAVGAVVVGGAWYLSSRLTKIDDRLKSIEKKCSSRCGFPIDPTNTRHEKALHRIIAALKEENDSETEVKP